MNAIVQNSFDSLETALANLVDSIAAYNPSSAAASTLVNADNSVAQSLELLARHQSNYRKIRALQQHSEALDQRLTQLLTALAQTRKELLAVSAASFPDSRELPYEELLTYARKISKFTRPPNQRAIASGAGETDDTAVVGDTDKSRLGLGLTDEEAAALDPSSRAPFTPWPSEEVMRRGALAQIALGIEPPSVPSQRNGLSSNEIAQPAEEKGQVNGTAGATTYTRPHGDMTRDRHQNQQEREQAAAAVFSGLDLFDPDAEDE